MGKKDNRRDRDDQELNEGGKTETATAVKEPEVPEEETIEASVELVPFSTLEQERGDVFKIIRDLESQLESTFAMKEALEVDLEASRKEVGDLRWTQKDLEARTKVLEEEAAAAADLQAELSFAEEEKTRALEKSQDLDAKLAQVTDERDAGRVRIKELQDAHRDSEKARGDLESQVYRLNDKVRALEEIQAKLVETRSERDKAVDRIRDLENELDATRSANKALELAIAHAEDSTKELRSDKKRLEKTLVTTQDEKRGLKSKVASLEEENEGALARVGILENEITTITGRNHALEAEMDASRKTLGEIHTALADTKAKARKRYYQVKKK